MIVRRRGAAEQPPARKKRAQLPHHRRTARGQPTIVCGANWHRLRCWTIRPYFGIGSKITSFSANWASPGLPLIL